MDKRIKSKKVIYYNSYKDDVIKSSNQDYKIKDNYKWIHKNIFYNIFSKIVFGLGKIVSYIYCKFFLHIKIENKEILNSFKNTGYFIYGNHTQPIGDAFIPFRITKKRFYTIASQSNLGIPVLGKLLPAGGALIIPDKISQTKELSKAIKTKIKENCAIIIYPEGHVWPYYTKIRPFEKTSFKFPVINNVPSFCMTVTYYKRKNKMGIKIYLDGPFFPSEKLNLKDKEKDLHDQIYNKMVERSKNSNYEFIKYEENIHNKGGII